MTTDSCCNPIAQDLEAGLQTAPMGPSLQWSVPDAACGDLLMDSLMPSFLVKISDPPGIRVATGPGCTT